MQALLLAFLAIMFYLGAGTWQGFALARRVQVHPQLVRGLGAVAVVAHAAVVYNTLHAAQGLRLGIFESASLICWLIAVLLIAVSFVKPVLSAAAALFPLAALSVLGVMGLPSNMTESHISPGVVVHILTSVLAYSLLAIASVQAILLAFQNQALKRHHTRGIVQVLPPLTTMERLLFELITVGMVLLTASIISGALFIHDMFAQHLAHKTVLSLLAWIIFGVLLWGRHYRGWRGSIAVRWTLGGIIVLFFAYFGSKFVLEFIYHREW
ncbi:cytochrome C assembly family protein [Phytohalomonas tamaricis]|uniref:cytochrome C assembly family protein n=1 Tax=Phytohalomonas tamaricis TaxID=2081032 RepID=UPI000D0B5972|nr:cytochrome c biogenesis protein CcsA [Phytohalomonas tamaricis]